MKTFGPAFFLMIGLLFSHAAMATDIKEFTKTIEKEFAITADGNTSHHQSAWKNRSKNLD